VPDVKILFISRNYPPQIGGLESYSYNLIKYIGEHHVVSKIVLGKPRRHLFWFMPYALLKAVQLVKKDRVLRIHLCDGFLSTIGVWLKFLLPVTLSVTIHGLDITFRNSLYQKIIPRCVARLDRVICVSQHAQKECINRGVPSAKTRVISNGINPADFHVPRSRPICRKEVAKRVGVSLEGKEVLLTVGRLVPRKGVAWFVNEVMPRLDDSHLYLIVGDGPDFERVSTLVRQCRLEGRVFMVGKVTKETRNILLHAADMFIMPNVQIDGDVEGFGIAAIEAGCCGLPVIASNLQGLKDAVLHGRTGFLVEAGNAEAFLDGIRKMDLDRGAVRSLVVETFDWERVSHRYEEVLGLFPSLGPVPHNNSR
jgi:glycosyltransferase involved in cell wall biosynthesis